MPKRLMPYAVDLRGRLCHHAKRLMLYFRERGSVTMPMRLQSGSFTRGAVSPCHASFYAAVLRGGGLCHHAMRLMRYTSSLTGIPWVAKQADQTDLYPFLRDIIYTINAIPDTKRGSLVRTHSNSGGACLRQHE